MPGDAARASGGAHAQLETSPCARHGCDADRSGDCPTPANDDAKTGQATGSGRPTVAESVHGRGEQLFGKPDTTRVIQSRLDQQKRLPPGRWGSDYEFVGRSKAELA